MTQEELNEVLRLHELWLKGKENGKQAVLHNIMLGRVDLCKANLRMAKMNWTNMRGAKLCEIDLSFADLRGADLSHTDLSFADLSCTNLSGAILCYSDLGYANLRNTTLFNADLTGANLKMAALGYNANFACAKGTPVYQAGCGFGSRNGTLTLLAQDNREEWRWYTGCFEGSEDELRKAVQEKYGDDGNGYWEAIDYLVRQAERNAAKKGITE